MEADARIVDTDELNIAALFDVEQPSFLTEQEVRIIVHVNRAIDVDRHGVIRSRVRDVNDVARRRRGLILARPKHVATSLGDFNRLFAGLPKRQNLRIGRHLCLGACHRRRCHECACHGGDAQQARQSGAHPHLLLPHRSSPYPYALAMPDIAWRWRLA